jgi:CDP-diacylglycerol---glycerol-3-phosphate 3-phosphatidyltransferase
MGIIINGITISRILLALSVVFFHSNGYLLCISLWAALTDFLDGHLARRLNLMSPLGERLDQVADKIFHLVILVWLFKLDLTPAYFVGPFVLREVLIMVLRYFGFSKSSSVALGKWKTVATYCYIIYQFGIIYFYSAESGSLGARVLEFFILLLSYWSLILSFKKAERK